MTMRNTQKGFSLIELLVTLFIVSILLSIAGPSFSSFMSNNRMAASVNEASISLHLARTEAIKRNSFVSVCPSADWDAPAPTCDPSASFSEGWIVFVDADGDGVPNLTIDVADTVLQTYQALHEDVDLRVANDTDKAVMVGDQFIIFAPTGYPMASLGGNDAVFNLQLCDDRGAKDTGSGISAGRWIHISPTGRPQMHRTKDAVGHANNPLGGCGYMSSP